MSKMKRPTGIFEKERENRADEHNSSQKMKPEKGINTIHIWRYVFGFLLIREANQFPEARTDVAAEDRGVVAALATEPRQELRVQLLEALGRGQPRRWGSEIGLNFKPPQNGPGSCDSQEPE